MVNSPTAIESLARNLDEHLRWYTAYHARRYTELLVLLNRYVPDSSQRILDVGRSKLTELLNQQFRVPIDTLGFPEDGPTTTGHHYCFDLNEAQWRKRWRTDLPAYDVIVIAEVLEHLYTSPALVLSFLKSLLKPGGLLVLQTPNAVALGNRIKLLCGRNPFDLIPEDNSNPKHFREYTEQELREYASRVGFGVVECVISSYFDQRYISHKPPTAWQLLKGSIKNIVYRHLPRSLRSGITLVMRKPCSAETFS